MRRGKKGKEGRRGEKNAKYDFEVNSGSSFSFFIFLEAVPGKQASFQMAVERVARYSAVQVCASGKRREGSRRAIPRRLRRSALMDVLFWCSEKRP
jgi:hypothetical protein